MIARLDYRPMMTAALVLATIVVLWVVLAAFLIMSPQAPAPTSFSVGNPAAYATGGSSELTNSPTIERHAEVVAAYKSGGVVGADFTKGSSLERHAEVVAAYNAAH